MGGCSMNAMSVTKFAWEENQKQIRVVERSYLEWVLKKNYSTSAGQWGHQARSYSKPKEL